MLDEMTTPTMPALADAHRRLDDAVTALRTGTPDVRQLSAAVTGTHDMITTLTDLVEVLIEHATTTLDREPGREVVADLKSLHSNLTAGALLLSPTLGDLRALTDPD
jgi:hypothetical protein